ncbi:MAG: HAMP domain-containing sensor histidine kinase [candidate division WOR-3 bacterium]
MATKSSYPRDIATISVVFILLIIFLAVVNLYVSSQLRKAFIATQEAQISSLARICFIYLNNPDKEKSLRLITESFNLRHLILTDTLGNRIYDSSAKFPGIVMDNTKIFSQLPEPGKMIQIRDNLVYHNPEPEFYLYLFNYSSYAAIDNIFRWHLIYITLSLILISFLGFFLIRDLLLPMRYVARVAQRYGIEMKKDDFVSMTFNEIFTKLKDREKELLEFSAYVAHEFRNSLATITGLARLIQKGKKDPSEIIQECSVMEGLIANLLEYARPAKLMKNKFLLNELLEEALRKTGCPDRIVIEKELNYLNKIYADYELLLSAMVNLLKNSIEAISDTGRIRITTNSEEDSIIISVADTGRGISEDDLRNIFSPFYSSKESGTGLGLAFVKKVVDLHDGKIIAKSVQGKGTEFIIKIPLSPQA